MGIPIVYNTVRHEPCRIVDGGVLSNYPMFLFTRRNPFVRAENIRPDFAFTCGLG